MTQGNLEQRYQQARERLATVGQAHVLHFWAQLDFREREQLLEQVDQVDWPEVARLVKTHVQSQPRFDLSKHDVRPAPYYPHHPRPDQEALYRRARQRGIDLLAGGKVAAFTVAGGQGTRLGWEGPKGTYPATPIRGLSLFGCLAEYLQRASRKWGGPIPWYIMTSPGNDAATRRFFRDHGYFGLREADVMFFSQGMMPAIDMSSGKVLLQSPGSLALSPNGHGGSLKALYTSGAVADMRRRGIEQISYTQVDNPIVRVVDPLFLGLHDLEGAQMSSKMLLKAYPMEKLGNFCILDGKLTVIEYSDLPADLAQERLEDGTLRFKAGSIAIHALRVDFVEALSTGPQGSRLPFHRAEKKVPYVDLETGRPVQPDRPNAVKLEMFVFDALPLTQRSVIYETDRLDEFAPIKNASGPDSPATSRAIQIERAVRWLAHHGVAVPRGADGHPAAVVEIRQSTAIEPEDLRQVTLPQAIQAGDELLI